MITVTGDTTVPVQKITFDSRKVEEGDLFVAIRGLQTDGHRYINDAINQGATAIICEENPADNSDATIVKVKNSSETLAKAAANFFDNPSAKLKLIGVTGTNGKTTIVSLLHQLMQNLGKRSGMISTIRYVINNRRITATHTTPDSLKINEILADMVNAGCEYCFMEVSSHAVVQNRTKGLHFAGGVFTNLSHDHLDYHKTFKDYLAAKKLFFDGLSDNAFALTNTDDKNGAIMLQNTRADKHTYGLKTPADFKCKIIEDSFEGLQLNLNGNELWCMLAGRFNAYNLTAVYGAAVLLGFDKRTLLTALSELSPVEGRLEMIKSQDGTVAVVDYAHSPDALQNVLATINSSRKKTQQTITVIGAGGDRDKTKRPLMGKLAANLSNRVIFTSDNPRSESPSAIIKDMMDGVEHNLKTRVLSIIQREEAIRAALMMANPGDIVLVAGKGHETYQEINGVRHPFDDRLVIRDFFGIKSIDQPQKEEK